jgi:primosomal protein N' (replication factor Y)
MVPEINLTPQLEERFRARFCTPVWRRCRGVDAQRHDARAAAAKLAGGPQRLGAHCAGDTRMAVFASMPHLKLIVVDEEHDPSYKSHEGARYSARDLAIYRGRLEGARVILGSATPSLESWYHSRPKPRVDATCAWTCPAASAPMPGCHWYAGST